MRYYSGMLGLGDNFYQRAVIRELAPCYLMTSWPQLYADLPVRCVKPQTRLRTQAKNGKREDLRWHSAPHNAPQQLRYSGHGTMLGSLFESAGLNPVSVNFDGPSVGITHRARQYIVIRPGTIRGEWLAAARNPDPEYLCRVSDALRGEYDIISIADLDGVNEYAVEPLPFAHEKYHAGELTIDELLPLIAGAAGVVGGVGWLLPASIAYHTPMLLLYGGWGHVNGHQHILDPRLDTSNLVQAMPDRYCMCNDRAHACDKTISNLDDHLADFANRLVARRATALVS